MAADEPVGGGPPTIVPFTALRGLAAAWVVGLHASLVFQRLLPEASAFNRLLRLGGLAVPLFFVLSGYVLWYRYRTALAQRSSRSTVRFFLLRIARVYPVHLATLLATLLVVGHHGWPTDGAHTPESFLANLLLVQSWTPRLHLTWNYPAWSISSEWFVYLLFPLLVAAAGGFTRRSWQLTAVAMAGASAWVYWLGSGLPFEGIVVVFPTFVGGVALAALSRGPSGAQRRSRVPDLCVLLGVLIPYAVADPRVQRAAFLSIFFVLVGALGRHGSRVSAVWSWRPLEALGNASYSLYMTHVLTIALLVRFLPLGKVVAASVTVRVAALFLGAAVIVAVAAACYLTIERPARRALRKMTLGRLQAREALSVPSLGGR
ncbi:MAG: acyltransferase [Gemmatimonadota bacterium]|nr:acyltransferase [Gemmatimonadota bacterium]